MNLLRSASFLLASVLLFAGCHKGPAVNPGGGGGGGGSNTGGPGGGPTLNGSPMIMGTFGGQDISMVADGNTVIVNSTMAPGTPTLWISGVIDVPAMQFANFFFGTLETMPTNAEFSALFSTGTMPYAIVQGLMEDGVEFEYLDEDQMEWRTSCGTADQSGSTFEITAVQSTSGPDGLSMRIVGKFTAKLYECNSGDMMQVTDGKFRLDIPNY